MNIMDQYLSTVIIAMITGIFSIITLIIQKKQDKVINKIDKQTKFLEKEKSLKNKLEIKEKELNHLSDKIMILILDTNLYILNNTNLGEGNISVEDVQRQSQELKEAFRKITEDIHQINKEYEMLLELTREFQEPRPPHE